MKSPTLQIQHILLPIDDSPGTQAATDVAVVLARALNASITFVHVDEMQGSMVAIVPGASVEGDLASARTASQRMLHGLVDELTAIGFMGAKTLSVSSRAVAPALVEAARNGKYDLIVMGTHARTGVSRLVVGSIAEEVLRRAHCPVLTVHLPPETD